MLFLKSHSFHKIEKPNNPPLFIFHSSGAPHLPVNINTRRFWKSEKLTPKPWDVPSAHLLPLRCNSHATCQWSEGISFDATVIFLQILKYEHLLRKISTFTSRDWTQKTKIISIILCLMPLNGTSKGMWAGNQFCTCSQRREASIVFASRDRHQAHHAPAVKQAFTISHCYYQARSTGQGRVLSEEKAPVSSLTHHCC